MNGSLMAKNFSFYFIVLLTSEFWPHFCLAKVKNKLRLSKKSCDTLPIEN